MKVQLINFAAATLVLLAAVSGVQSVEVSVFDHIMPPVLQYLGTLCLYVRYTHDVSLVI